MSTLIQSNQCVTLPNATTYTVQAQDSGKIMCIPAQGAAMTVTLPNVQAGLCYRFIAVATLGQNVTIQAQLVGAPPAPANILTGICLNFTPGTNLTTAIASVIKLDDPNIRFNAAARAGDYVDLNCDGTTWYINGVSRAVGFT